MGGEFLAGIIAAIIIAFVAYRIYKDQKAEKKPVSKSKLPPDIEK